MFNVYGGLVLMTLLVPFLLLWLKVFK